MTLIPSSLTVEAGIDNFPDELKAYFQNKFCSLASNWLWLATDEPFIESWEGYVANHGEGEAFQLLRTCYPQLHFPIEEGINKTQDYIDAVLKGKLRSIDGKSLLGLNRPANLTIQLHRSIAGKVPVLLVPDEQDFSRIIQCLLYRNNPTPIPSSMGALLVNGVNNWDRIHALKRKWLLDNPMETWANEFSKHILPTPDLYKDKLIVLSTKPYSNVSADCLGLTDTEWAAYSLSIRLEHECAHLYTLKRFGSASNNLHDELIADYVGISKTIGSYNTEWMLAFMGLEEYPNYRKGARLENYVANAHRSSGSFEQITTVIKRAIETIACFDAQLGTIHSEHDQMCRMDALCTTGLIDMASANGANLLLETYNEQLSVCFSETESREQL